ncbi:amino acid permease [Nitrospirillum sp. BR 11163]|uniref:amino acid permease n=1 Tax=Nitrospirillum sp. BR 11163 TaxID=3104323 RepID=UPI002AFDFA4A|nr:amino acid permease [Nitrospirillum sp. BR 11163]MEA1675262.1 amino acid permease [Nitrospirillum sp. BR 11163]
MVLSLWTKKTIEEASADGDGDESRPTLARSLNAWNLTALGIGAIIGAGIFVLTGSAAAQYAGPGIVLSFVLAATACLFAGLCYAEFSAMVPVAGSAYTYAYVTVGQFLAWIIGWDLALEYLFASGTVAVGWSGYFVNLLKQVGIVIPEALTSAPLTVKDGFHFQTTGAVLNLPAVLMVGLITLLLYVGIRNSARVNGIIVLLKLLVVFLVIGFGLFYVVPAHWSPLIPAEVVDDKGAHYGWGGVLRGAGVIFFAYIGFDAVSTTAQEAVRPQRDMPIGILGSLAFCTVLYILMSLVLTGLVPYTELNVPHPVVIAIEAVRQLHWLALPVDIGAVAGLTTVMLVMMLGQSRVLYAMSRDKLLPPVLSKVHPTYRTPHVATVVTGVLAALLAGLFPIDILGELVSIGTLLAFAIVCGCVLVLRITQPAMARPFKTPLFWLVCPLGVLVCGYLMYGLPGDTWLRLVIWMVIGFFVYFLYSRRRAA